MTSREQSANLIPDIGMAFSMGARYPTPPFDPPEHYPEFDQSSVRAERVDSNNIVYSLVREALFRHLDGYDAKNNAVDLSVLRSFGTIKRILIKPNWVYQQYENANCITTHGSILRPVLDYLFLVFGSSATIIVADVPLQSSDIDQIWQETGIHALRDHYTRKNLSVTFLDLRRERAVRDSTGFIVGRESLAGDPLGYAEVNLDEGSYLEEISGPKSIFSVNDYEPGMATSYHRPGKHRYLIPRTVLASELFVNIPKLKTHCKAGVTVCMKNLIGINGEKGWIPHFRVGAPSRGGDEYSDNNSLVLGLKTRIRDFLQERHQTLFRMAYYGWTNYKRGWERLSRSNLTSGGEWPGNDTLWRSILDLVRVITFADVDGVMKEKPQRKHLCVIDGIICGEGEGPLTPTPKPVGAILCSSNPIHADWAACHVAGFDWKKIAQLFHASELSKVWQGYPDNPDSLTVSFGEARSSRIRDLPVFPFKPPSEWIGHIEVDGGAIDSKKH